MCARAIAADSPSLLAVSRRPTPPRPPLPPILFLSHRSSPASSPPSSSLSNPSRSPRREVDWPDRPGRRDVFCIELTKCTSRIFIAPTNIAGRGRVTDTIQCKKTREDYQGGGEGGEERKKKKEKSEEKRRKPFRSDSAALTNPDEGPRRFPNGPLCVGCSVCGTSPPSSGDPAICKSVCLSLPVLPATIFYVKDKLLRKYITDITPKCGLVFIHPKRYVRDKYLV